MTDARELAETAIDKCEGCACDHCTDKVTRIIAAALMEASRAGAERERERAAQAAEGRSREFDFQKALAECRDDEAGFHSGRLAAASAIRNP